MCRLIAVRATLTDGSPHPGMPRPVELELPAEGFTPDFPTCTCNLGEPDSDGETLRRTLMETVLRPFLQEISWGNIVIEIR